MYEIAGSDDVQIMGCDCGTDIEVIPGDLSVQLTTTDGRIYQVPLFDWEAAVCRFSDAVESFYAASAPRVLLEDIDQKGIREVSLRMVTPPGLGKILVA